MSSNYEKDQPPKAGDSLPGVEELVIDTIDEADETVPPEFRGCKVVELRTDNGSVLLYKGKSGFTASEEQAKILIQAYRLEKESEAEAAKSLPETRPGGRPGRVSAVETPIPGDLVLRVLGYGSDVPEKLQGSRLIQRGKERFYLTLDGEAIPEDVGRDLLASWDSTSHHRLPPQESAGQGETISTEDDDALLEGEPTVTDGGEQLRARVLELAAREGGAREIVASESGVGETSGQSDGQEIDDPPQASVDEPSGETGSVPGGEDGATLRAAVGVQADPGQPDDAAGDSGGTVDRAQVGGEVGSPDSAPSFSEPTTSSSNPSKRPVCQDAARAAMSSSEAESEWGASASSAGLRGLDGLRLSGPGSGAKTEGERTKADEKAGETNTGSSGFGGKSIADSESRKRPSPAAVSDVQGKIRRQPAVDRNEEPLSYSAEELTRAAEELAEAADLLRRDLATSVLKLKELSPPVDEMRGAFWRAVASPADGNLERFVRRSLEMSESIASLWRDSEERRQKSWLQDMESGTLVVCALNPLQAAQTDFLSLVTLIRMRSNPEAAESCVNRMLEKLRRDFAVRFARDLTSKVVMQTLPGFVTGLMKEGDSRPMAVEAWLRAHLSQDLEVLLKQVRESEGIWVPGLVEHLLDVYRPMIQELTDHLVRTPGK